MLHRSLIHPPPATNPIPSARAAQGSAVGTDTLDIQLFLTMC